MTQDITALEELKISEEVGISTKSIIFDKGANIQGIGKVESQTESGVRKWVSKRTSSMRKKKDDEEDSVSTTLYLSLFSASNPALFSPL